MTVKLSYHRFQFALLPRTDLCITDTPNNRPYKTFLVRNLYKFYFRQCYTISFKFSLIFITLFCSQFNGWRVSRLQRCPKRNWAGIRTRIQSRRFLLHMFNHLFCKVRISINHSISILVHFVGWLFHTLQTLANQWLPNYHINMISSNILFLDSFSSQHRPLDTLWGWLYNTLTFQNKFLKQNKSK